MMRSYLPSSWSSRTRETVDAGAAEAAALDKLRPAGSNVLAALPAGDVLGAFCARSVAAADAVLLEFVRLCSGDARKAESAVKVMAEWRRSVKVWEAGTERGDVMTYLGSPGVEFPIWIDNDARIGYLMVKDVPKKFSYPKLEKGVGVLLDWVLFTANEGLDPADGLIAIADFSGFSVSQADVRALTITVRTYMKAYPGAFEKIIIVNYPVAIYGLWKIVTPLLDQRTYDSVVFLSSTMGLRAELEKMVPPASIPDFLGGDAATEETRSGVVQLANGNKLDTAAVVARLC